MRWADLDQLGHVNNVVYVDYLQEARVDMLRVHARSQAHNREPNGAQRMREEQVLLEAVAAAAAADHFFL